MQNIEYNKISGVRISRDGRKWTNWSELSETINNFPKFTPTDKMFFDLKIIRDGGSNVGDIRLNSSRPILMF